MPRRLLLCAALAMATCGTASAQSVQQVVSEFALLGTWAADCDQPAARNNIYTVYTLSGGSVRRIYYDAPSKIAGDAIIISAARVSADQIVYDQELTDANRTRIKVVLTRIGGRIKVWLSQRTDGQILVQDGRVLSNGSESPWQSRCRN